MSGVLGESGVPVRGCFSPRSMGKKETGGGKQKQNESPQRRRRRRGRRRGSAQPTHWLPTQVITKSPERRIKRDTRPQDPGGYRYFREGFRL